MPSVPDRIEVHVYGAPGPPPQRRGPSLGAVVFVIVFWPAILVGLVAVFVLTLVLTAVGVVVAAGGGVIWLAGRVIALRWPEAGAGVIAVGRGIARGVIHGLDVMNGHATTRRVQR